MTRTRTMVIQIRGKGQSNISGRGLLLSFSCDGLLHRVVVIVEGSGKAEKGGD